MGSRKGTGYGFKDEFYSKATGKWQRKGAGSRFISHAAIVVENRLKDAQVKMKVLLVDSIMVSSNVFLEENNPRLPIKTHNLADSSGIAIWDGTSLVKNILPEKLAIKPAKASSSWRAEHPYGDELWGYDYALHYPQRSVRGFAKNENNVYALWYIAVPYAAAVYDKRAVTIDLINDNFKKAMADVSEDAAVQTVAQMNDFSLRSGSIFK